MPTEVGGTTGLDSQLVLGRVLCRQLVLGRVLDFLSRRRLERPLPPGRGRLQRRRGRWAAVHRQRRHTLPQRDELYDARPGQRSQCQQLCNRSRWWLVVQRLLPSVSDVRPSTSHMGFPVGSFQQNDDQAAISDEPTIDVDALHMHTQ